MTTPILGRRRFLYAATAGLFCWSASHAVPAQAQAQDYPARPISLIVPYGPGGSTDAFTRALGEQLSRRLGQAVVIENRAGAGGTMGASQVARARPDGYSLTLAPLSVFRQPYLTSVAFDPIKDLTYIASVANYSYAIAVPFDAPWQTIRELVEDAQARPGVLNYAGSAQYSSNHLAMVELGRVAELDWTFVPHRGDADAITSIMGGHIDVISATTTILPYIESRQLRALAVAGPQQSGYFPGVPTLKESGYDVEIRSPFGVAGPAGMPEDVVRTLDQAIRESLQDPTFVQRARALGMDIAYLGHDAYTEWAAQTYASEKDIVHRLTQE